MNYLQRIYNYFQLIYLLIIILHGKFASLAPVMFDDNLKFYYCSLTYTAIILKLNSPYTYCLK